MAYRHGIYISELDTQITPAITLGAPPVVVGTSLITDDSPKLVYTFKDFIANFGYSNDFDNATLCEAAQVFFNLFAIRPIIFISVTDTTKHAAATATTKNIEGAKVGKTTTFDEPILLETLEIKSGADANVKTLIKDTDYTATFSSGGLTIKILKVDKVVANKIAITYKKLDANKVEAADVIGGEEANGRKSGLHLIEEIFPRFQLLPGCLIAPKFSSNIEVAAAMKARCTNINGVFKTVAIADINPETTFDGVAAYKTTNNLVDANLILTYPKVKLGTKTYWLSTQLAAVTARVDAENNDIPYVSPSNKSLQCSASVLADGSEIYLSLEEADYLNSLGVVTAVNFNGWRVFGNRTSIYPDSADTKDNFIACRRMLSWLGNTLVTTFFSRLDAPLNKRLIESVATSANRFISGLVARGALLPGSNIRFLAEENNAADLADGKVIFHVVVGLISPARHIEFVLENDVSLYENLFSA